MENKLLNNEAVIQYLIEYHATRDYFECHEIMEEFWKTAPKDEYSNLWLAFIQIAVAQYHDRRGNNAGATRMYNSALLKLKSYISSVEEIDLAKLCSTIEHRLTHISQPYYDFNFDIKSEQLMQQCQAQTRSRNLVWGISSKEVSIDIIDRHIRRDRHQVIENRQQALLRKKKDVNLD